MQARTWLSPFQALFPYISCSINIRKTQCLEDAVGHTTSLLDLWHALTDMPDMAVKAFNLHKADNESAEY